MSQYNLLTPPRRQSNKSKQKNQSTRLTYRTLISLSATLLILIFLISYFHELLYFYIRAPEILDIPISSQHHQNQNQNETSIPPPPPRHTYTSTGLLSINPLAPHPIYELITRARELWRAKLARQSTTLPAAIREYHRRYRRYPPPGFDKWWDYAERHSVQLKDEYDQIWRDLEPFWGLTPARARALRKRWAERLDVDSYTIGKVSAGVRNASLLSVGAGGEAEYVKRHWEMMLDVINVEGVAQWLPEFEATFSPHDNPLQFVDHEWKKQTMIAGIMKKPLADSHHIEPSVPFSPHLEDRLTPEENVWASLCAPHTIYRDPLPPSSSPPPPSTPKSLIFDHSLTLEPCIFRPPSHFAQHGIFLSHTSPPPPPLAPDPTEIERAMGRGDALASFGGFGTTEIAPVFGTCNTKVHADIVAATPYLWTEDVGGGAWGVKSEHRLLWRGSNTGSFFSSSHPQTLTHSHRTRLVSLTSQLPHSPSSSSSVQNISILPPSPNPTHPTGNATSHSPSDINPLLFDVAFTGRPIQCEEPSCSELAQMFEWRTWMDVEEEGTYRYIIDVDGNGWSGRFKRLMTSGSLIFKSTIFVEWFTDRIAPWVHYVPIQVNYSDLYDTLTFFRGDVRTGEFGHPELAEEIASAGREWSMGFWRKEDMSAYMFRLYLEYARVMSDDRDQLDFRVEDIED